MFEWEMDYDGWRLKEGDYKNELWVETIWFGYVGFLSRFKSREETESGSKEWVLLLVWSMVHFFRPSGVIVHLFSCKDDVLKKTRR